MATITQSNTDNFLTWQKVNGVLPLATLQANGLPSVQDNLTPPYDFINALVFDWYKPNDVSAENVIMSYSTGGGSLTYISLASSTTIDFKAGNSGSVFTVPEMVVGNWYHLMIVRDGTSGMLWLNGDASLTVTTIASGNANIDQLGTNFDNSLYLDGQLDEIAMWGTITGTSQNAADLYNNSKGAYSDSIISSPDVYYKLNETGTTVIATSSGNSNNGTLTNFPAGGMWVTH
jgi:hypothetical protein